VPFSFAVSAIYVVIAVLNPDEKKKQQKDKAALLKVTKCGISSWICHKPAVSGLGF